MIALYARVSTRDKEQNSETQLRPLRAWAEGQGEPYKEYVDHASAVKMQDRTAWARLLMDVKAGGVQRVRVLRLDRAFRDVRHLHAQLSEFQAMGTEFSTLTEHIDVGTPMGDMVVTILGAVAQFERDLTAMRIREGLDRARAEGKTLGRPRGATDRRRRQPRRDRGQRRIKNPSLRRGSEQIGNGTPAGST